MRKIRFEQETEFGRDNGVLGAFASLWRRLTVRGRPRILVIDDWVPDPRIGAGAPRALVLYRAIVATGASVTLLPTLNDPDNAADIRRLLPGAEVALGYGRAGMGRFLSRRRGEFDLIVISRPHNMANFRAAAVNGTHALDTTPIIYDAEALFAMRDALRREVLGEPSPPERVAQDMKDEIALADGARMILAVNKQTGDAFKAAGHADVRVLGYAVAPQPTPVPFEQRDGFLFVGPTDANITPNSDSVVWFADQVLPRIHRRLARRVPLVLAGIQRSPLIAARVNSSLKSFGMVSDLVQLYSSARVFIAPTRFASGIPIKVHDAAAHGVPVVLTPLLAEQIGWRHEEEALLAQSPQDFAAQCLRLHEDRDLWQHIRLRALSRVTEDCDPPRFNRVVSEALAEATRGQTH